jgi:hypothetical protein
VTAILVTASILLAGTAYASRDSLPDDSGM